MAQASSNVLRGAKCLNNPWLRSLHQVLEITWFTMMGYAPFLLSSKISASQLLPLLTPWLLVPKSEHANEKSSKAKTTLLKKLNWNAQGSYENLSTFLKSVGDFHFL